MIQIPEEHTNAMCIFRDFLKNAIENYLPFGIFVCQEKPRSKMFIVHLIPQTIIKRNKQQSIVRLNFPQNLHVKICLLYTSPSPRD